MHDILVSINQRMFDSVSVQESKVAVVVAATVTQTSRPNSPLASIAAPINGANGNTIDHDKTTAQVGHVGRCPTCQNANGGNSIMEVDSQVTSKPKSKKSKKKKKAAAAAQQAPSAPQKPTQSSTATTSTMDATWTEVVERKTKKRANVEAVATDRSDFPVLHSPKPVPQMLPPLRNAALIVKVPAGSSYEEPVSKLQQSGVNPDDFGATVAGMRKSKKGDVVVDLGRSPKIKGCSDPAKERSDREDLWSCSHCCSFRHQR